MNTILPEREVSLRLPLLLQQQIPRGAFSRRLRRQMGSNRATVGYDAYCMGGVAKGTHKKPSAADEPMGDILVPQPGHPAFERAEAGLILCSNSRNHGGRAAGPCDRDEGPGGHGEARPDPATFPRSSSCRRDGRGLSMGMKLPDELQ